MQTTGQQVPEFINSLSVLQLRVIITALTLLLIAVVVKGLVPTVAEMIEARLTDAISESRFAPTIPYEELDIPTPVISTILTRLLQVTLFSLTALFLLSVWGVMEEFNEAVSVAMLAVPTLTKMTVTVLLVIGSYLGAAAINNRVRNLIDNYHRIDKHQIEIIARSIQLCFIGAVSLIVLSVWNIQIGQILIGAGLLGIVIGLAVRETLSAVLSGFLLMFSRPFEIGDWIEAADQEGVVTNITILNTRLRSADGESIVIPNDQISSETIVNKSRRNRLRIDLEVGVDYETDIEQAVEVAKEAVENCDKVCESPSPEVLPQEFGNSAITLEARFWIDNPGQRRYSRAVGEVMKHVKANFDEHDIDIPFPQRTLNYRESTPEDGQTAVTPDPGGEE